MGYAISPDDNGILLWTNGYCVRKKLYYDINKCQLVSREKNDKYLMKISRIEREIGELEAERRKLYPLIDEYNSRIKDDNISRDEYFWYRDKLEEMHDRINEINHRINLLNTYKK